MTAALAFLAFLLGYIIGRIRDRMADFSRVNAALDALDVSVHDAVAALTAPDADQSKLDEVAARIDAARVALDEAAPPATP